jgi:hypothetical protein
MHQALYDRVIIINSAYIEAKFDKKYCHLIQKKKNSKLENNLINLLFQVIRHLPARP